MSVCQDDMLSCLFGVQILDVNSQNCEKVSHNRALEFLRGSTHLSITVKSNALGNVAIAWIFGA